jgi:hypothetical protein
MRFPTVLLLAAALAPCADLPREWLERALRNHLDEFAPAAADRSKPVTTRDLTNGALLNLMTGGGSARSEAWIERAYATQDMDPASKTYGELKGAPAMRRSRISTRSSSPRKPWALSTSPMAAAFPADSASAWSRISPPPLPVCTATMFRYPTPTSS